MADYVQVPPDSTGKKVDARSLDVGADTVMRQRIILADNSATAQFATVTGGALLTTLAAGATVNDISKTVQVAIATPFTVQNISATTVVSGNVNISATHSVILAAGTANVGTVNDISRTVQVAIGTPFTLQGISTTVIVAVSTPFTVNNISASVLVATGATADFNTLASADQVQTLPLFGLALPAAGGAVAGGTNSNPLWVNVNATSHTDVVALAAGTANIGTVNDISRTVQVAIGTPFTIQNISATTVVSGNVNLSATASVILAAGTANIGTLNDISRTVQVAIGTPFTVQNVSATVIVAGTVNLSLTAAVVVGGGTANIGFINNISATVTVAGNVNISTMPAMALSAGTAAIGSVFVNAQPEQYSSTHGPKCVVVSTSVGVALVAAPAAGEHVYVTMLACTNASGTLTRADIFQASQTATCVAKMVLAASGGGFVIHYDPPIKLQSATGLTGRVKPGVSECFFNVHFYVGA